MQLRIKKLVKEAVIPAYQTEGSAGFDLVSVEEGTIQPGARSIIGTGLSVAVPKGYEMQVRPRSGLAAKAGITVTNSPGTVDSDYRGEIKVILQNTGSLPFEYKQGDRIAQGVICPVVHAKIEVVEDLDETDRGQGGFGSTGT